MNLKHNVWLLLPYHSVNTYLILGIDTDLFL